MSNNLWLFVAGGLKKSDNLVGRARGDYRLGMRTALAIAALIVMSVPAVAATCVLEVDGKSYIDGLCEFWPISPADFQIIAGDYFAYVYPSEKPVMGYWNGVDKGSHAHDPLGELTRDGACWVNDRAKVCAYAK